MWGADERRDRTDEHGRPFHYRTDGQLRDELSGVGDVIHFETWPGSSASHHYQFALLRR
ncbi:MAG: hypothetical protein QM607_05915 [Microbacterium sp.]